ALEDILLGLVCVCGLYHLVWLSESLGLPGTAPLYGPGQDAWKLCPEMGIKIEIALLLGDVDREGDQPDALPDGVIVLLDDRFVVRAEKEFELGSELEVFMEKEARLDRVCPARHALDEGFCEASPLLRLHGAHIAAPREVSQVVAHFVTLFV